MEEMELRTSLKQRIGITLIAVIMVGSIIASYVAIVASGGGASSASDTEITDEKLAAYETAYEEKKAEFQAVTTSEYNKYSQYLDKVAEYNEDEANAGEVRSSDLVVGDGRELTEGDTDYLAFYTGWCADGTVFDSTLDDTSEPTGFVSALPASTGLISGWTTGVIGMKLGGIREITIPGEYAYQDQMEICGGHFKPLKFLVMAVEKGDALSTLASETSLAYTKLQYAYYGIDYEKLSSQ
ncbi:FKBP-type peptidyl-prolyl cis-trans isomerase [Candidatus Saccharibacteria bacterium]|nr:FKBP-type peptidyl-prolyl cis-trans isomerase [Candidatus Saccharibacteria bacterium]MBQ3264112.1 FKBP-type peptidyl-prolyl cis-trans isomerase [Candidatus Saccharibacteria bacterium]